MMYFTKLIYSFKKEKRKSGFSLGSLTPTKVTFYLFVGKWQTTALIFPVGVESHGEHCVVLLLYLKSGDWMA